MPDQPDLRPEQQQRIIQYMSLLSIIVFTVSSTASLLPQPHTDPEPYHMSVLTGEGWLLELLTGYPDCIRTELRMRIGPFNDLILLLRSYGHSNAQFVSLEEQLAIFLYMCITGLPTRHVGE